MAFSTVPAPLYPLFQQRDGFGEFIVAVVFAVYALGVLASLIGLGQLSDAYGRRVAAGGGLLVSVVAAAVLVAWPALPGLLLARLLNGLSVGVVTAACTAQIVELERLSGRQNPARADMIATAATMGGLAAGPLIAGIVAVSVAAPLTTPFLLFVVPLGLALLGMRITPETIAPSKATPRLIRPIRLHAAGAGARPAWIAIACAYSAQGLFASLVPGLLRHAHAGVSPAVTGAVVCWFYAVAAASQLVLYRRSARQQLATGSIVLPVAMACVTVGVASSWLPVVALGGTLAGLGAGSLARGSIATVNEVAEPGLRGEALAGLFLAGYVGLSLPALGLGLGIELVGSAISLTLFTALIAVGIAIATRMRRRLSATPAHARAQIDAPSARAKTNTSSA